MPAAHIVATAPLPAALAWGAALLLCAGGVGMVAMRRAPARRLAAAIAAAGLLGSATLEVAGSVAPPAPGSTLRLSVAGPPTALTSPAAVRVCGSRGAGPVTPVPDPASLLAVVVDGHGALSTSQPRFALVMTPGVHVLDVHLVDRRHREYSPPVRTRLRVVILGVGPLGTPPGCAAEHRPG